MIITHIWRGQERGWVETSPAGVYQHVVHSELKQSNPNFKWDASYSMEKFVEEGDLIAVQLELQADATEIGFYHESHYERRWGIRWIKFGEELAKCKLAYEIENAEALTKL